MCLQAHQVHLYIILWVALQRNVACWTIFITSFIFIAVLWIWDLKTAARTRVPSVCSEEYLFTNIARPCIRAVSDCTIISPSTSLATLTFSLKTAKKEFSRLGKVKKFFAICRAFYINNVPQFPGNMSEYQSWGKAEEPALRFGWKILLSKFHAESPHRNFRGGRRPF